MCNTRLARTAAAALLVAAAASAPGQDAERLQDSRLPQHLVLPQTRAFPLTRGAAPVEITSVHVRARILEDAAQTTLEVALRNPGRAPAEATLLLPVPDGAVVSAFAFEGAAREPTARLLPRAEARRTYDEIVSRLRDPALLEFAGASLVRSSVFPVPAGGTQRVRVTYEEVLEGDGARLDYVLPRSESLGAEVPWDVVVDVRSRLPVATLFSPTHEIRTERLDDHHLRVRLDPASAADPGPLRLCVLRGGDAVTATAYAYPDPAVGGGWFLLLAGLPQAREAGPPPARELTLVIDRSGSMAGEKLAQVRVAALRAIEGLRDGETFRLLDYGNTVGALCAEPLRKEARTVDLARRHLARTGPSGGTNLGDALVEALRPAPAAGSVPLVVFLTDGMPTVGRTKESEIRDLARTANLHGRRVFTLGVGTDVNAPLLDRVAEASRGTSDYLLPGDDATERLERLVRRLEGPVLRDAELAAERIDGLEPAVLPDLYQGDRLVVLGRYRDGGPVTFRLDGELHGRRRSMEFTFDLGRAATTRNAFVARLWAARRIATLTDEVRQLGADGAPSPAELERRNREIVALATRFGIVTDHTSFLALEGTDLSDLDGLLDGCRAQLRDLAVGTRSGDAAVAQSRNVLAGKGQWRLNPANVRYDAKLDRIAVTTVRQVADRAFYLRGETWIDARLAGRDRAAARTVEFGSTEHARLVRALAAEGAQSALALPGDVLLDLRGETVHVRNPGTGGPGPRPQNR